MPKAQLQGRQLQPAIEKKRLYNQKEIATSHICPHPETNICSEANGESIYDLLFAHK